MISVDGGEGVSELLQIRTVFCFKCEFWEVVLVSVVTEWASKSNAERGEERIQRCDWELAQQMFGEKLPYARIGKMFEERMKEKKK